MPRNQRDRIDESVVATFADDLARIVPLLGIEDTSAFWARIRNDWSADDLRKAIDDFNVDGTIYPFRALLLPRAPIKPVGYWKSFDNVVRAIREAETALGHMPLFTELTGLRMFGLMDGIQKHHGGYRAVRERMGVPLTTTRHGTWDDWDDVESTLRPIVDELGRFPIQDELEARGLGSLVNAVVVKHGGLTAARMRMGAARISHAHVPVWDEVERDLRAIASELGHFPTGAELVERGRTDLETDCQKHFGGLLAVTIAMGYVPQKHGAGHWDDLANAEPALLAVIAEIDRFPTVVELQDRGLATLASALTRRFGNMADAARHYGKPIRQHARGQWNTWEKAEPMLRQIIAELGKFPTPQDLWKHGYSGLVPCMRLYGGFAAVREKMGFSGYHKMGHWKEWANVEAVLRPIVDALGRFPTAGELRDGGHASMVASIQKHHGGLHAAAIRLGVAPNQQPAGHWETWENVEAAVTRAIETFGHFPSQMELSKNGFGFLPAACGRHGGLLAVRDRMGYIPISDLAIAERADVLARIVPMLSASTKLWSTMKSRWTTRDLDAAIARYESNGSVERFQALADG